MPTDKNKKGEPPSWIIKSVNIFWQRRLWFFVPLISGIILSIGLILILTQFYNSAIFPPHVREWLEAENIRFTRNSLDGLRKILYRQESEINQFERMNENELPSMLKANLRILGQLHTDLYETKKAIRAESTGEAKRGVWAEDWLKKRRDMANLQKQFPDRHPKVVAAKKEIGLFEKKVLDKEAAILAGDVPVALIGRETRLMEKVRLYESRIEKTPEREKAMALLLEKRNQTKAAYQALLDKKPSYVPDSVLIALQGILLGFLAGVVLVVVREKADRSIRTHEALGQLLSVPVFASILDYKEIPPEGKAKPSAMRPTDASSASLYGQKSLFVRGRP
jgi:hypothetical protein